MKYRRFYSITLIILLVHYLFLFYELNFCTINTHLVGTLIIFIPITLIIISYILAKKEKLNANVLLVFTISFIVIFLVLNFFIFIVISFEEAISYENNPLRYKHIYNIAGYSRYTYQFPNEIPNELLQNNKVQFFYCPQFLQGSFNMELVLEMSNEEIDNYISKYKNKVRKVIEVNDDISSLYGTYGINEPRWLFEYKTWEEFLNGCKIYLLESKSYKPNNWNHGYVAYMAKNEKLEKLLLVTEVW